MSVTFSTRLRELRKERRMTQEEMAALLGIKRTSYAFYESGNRTPHDRNLRKMAEFFGVSPEYLLGDTDDSSVKPMVVPLANSAAYDLYPTLQLAVAYLQNSAVPVSYKGQVLNEADRALLLRTAQFLMDVVDSVLAKEQGNG